MTNNEEILEMALKTFKGDESKQLARDVFQFLTEKYPGFSVFWNPYGEQEITFDYIGNLEQSVIVTG